MDLANRRDDWHHSVDTRLVNLTSAQKTTNDQLDEIREELVHFDRILRGNPEDRLDGLIESIHHMQTEINKFNAIMNPDHTGKGGLLNDIQALLANRRRSDKREGYHWVFWSAVVPVVVAQCFVLIGLLVVNWDKMVEWYVIQKHIHEAAVIEGITKQHKLERAIEAAKHPKNRYHHYVIQNEPKEENP